ncbi:AMP-binding protein [Rhodospirillaceae bacterium KN72]|uniref:AMP-binding protein n=1 Tax=Pacificispira spongiicola TaxID=2729598 RepID=A0A7Y0E3M7_9PROT|nr:long-chain fatty acid--CoA ligase [Pacificispira spongiicola]NMM46616.1 AMP-binding protein [Pacificispira spongiicola]
MPDTPPSAPEDGIGRTGDYLSFHAAFRPQATALADAGETLTFDALQDRVRKTIGALTNLGVRPGDFACVEWTGLLDHMPLLLALENLGAASATFLHDAQPQDNAQILQNAALIFVDRFAQGDLPGRRVRIDAVTGDGPDDTAPLPDTPIDPTSVFRMVTSSGTTGAPKVIAITLSQTERRLEVIQWMVGYSSHSRFVHSMPYTFQGAHFQAMTCLRAGGVNIHVTVTDFWRALSALKATHTAVLPFHFTQLQSDDMLRTLPEGLTITSYGGPVPDPMRARFQQIRPDVRLFETYATNELGTIAVRLTDGSYRSCPGSEVQIVDDTHRPLPPGTQGTVRIRKTGMVAGYVYDPRASAEKFRDGWFYPGDIGVQPDETRFRVLGREDTLMNVGGVKFSAEEHERALTALPEISDACLLTRPNARGENEIWVVLVKKDDLPLDALGKLVAEALPSLIGNIVLITTKQIPRTTSGKIRRQALHEALDRMKAPLQGGFGSSA